MKLYKREFLNDKEGTALIEVSAERESENWLDAGIKISDCDRMISLEFYCNDNKSRRDRIRKLDRIIANAQLLRGVLEAAKF